MADNGVSREEVILTYIGAFGRAPLKGGLEYWDIKAEFIDNTSQLFSKFKNDVEGLEKVPQEGNYVDEHAYHVALVEHLYTNLYNKGIVTYSNGTQSDPDPSGKAYWAGRLDTSATEETGADFYGVGTKSADSYDLGSEVIVDMDPDSLLMTLVNVSMSQYSDSPGTLNLQLAVANANELLAADPDNIVLQEAVAEAEQAVEDGMNNYLAIKATVNNRTVYATTVANIITSPTVAPLISTDLLGNQTFSTTEYVADLGDAYGVLDIDNTPESLATLLNQVAVEDINYSAEYLAAYDVMVEKSMTSSHAPLEKLFNMIDATSASDITAREKLSLKKDAYMQMLTQITLSCQKTAFSLVDKQYKFKDEVESAKASKQKLLYDASLTDSKRKVMLEQVVDNRRIKAMDSLGDTYSTGMAGGLVPTEAMWKEYFRLAKELTRNKLEDDNLTNYLGSWFPDSPNGLRSSIVDSTITSPYMTTDGTQGIVEPEDCDYISSGTPQDVPDDATVMYSNEAYKNISGSTVIGMTESTDFSDIVIWEHMDKTNASTGLGWWQSPADGRNGGVVVKDGFTVNSDPTDFADHLSTKEVGNYWTVNLANWDQNLPISRNYVEADGATRWTGDDDVEYTVTDRGTTVVASLIGTPVPVTKTNIPYTRMSITLDGINFWEHGDIVYVYGTDNADGTVSKSYRRIAGLSEGTTVTQAGLAREIPSTDEG